MLTALLGLYINLCFPKLDAMNDTVVVKQGAVAVISTFGAMLFVAAGMVLYQLTWRALGLLGAVALCAAFFAGSSAVLIKLLQTKGQHLFQEL